MSRKRLRRIFLIAAVSIILAAAALFMLQSPVLLVTDASLNLLYGKRRALFKQFEISFRLRRPVFMVQVAETAAPDAIAIGVKTRRAPHAVLFPYRYEAAASRYQEANPQTPVAVLGGRVRTAPGEGPRYMPTDSALDFYRAGSAAALVAEKNKAVILVYHDETLTDSGREAFSAGLKAGGRAEDPVFIPVNSDYSGWTDVACTVICGPAFRYFEKNLKSPALLFSWVDPGMTPRPIKVIFDDSPWALAVNAVKMMETGGEGPLPSEFIIPGGHVPDKILFEKLKVLAGEGPGAGPGNPFAIP